MYCSKCGNQLPVNSSFCNKCGEKLSNITINSNMDKSSEKTNLDRLVGAKGDYKVKSTNRVAVMILVIVLILGIGGSLVYFRVYLPKQEKTKIIYEARYGDIVKANEMADKYKDKYGADIEIIEEILRGLDKSIEQLESQLPQAGVDNIVVERVEYSPGFVKIIVRNASDYKIGNIKLGLYLLDNNVTKNVVDVDSVLWTGTLRKGESATILSYLNESINASAIKVEVEEVTTK